MVDHVEKPYRPVWERNELYEEVLKLRSQGLSYNKIIFAVELTTGVRLRKSHVSDWVNGKHRPFGYVRPFSVRPSAELAYVVGVKMGDASTSLTGDHNHRIKLRVTAKDFAEEFSRCLGMLLNREPPKVKWHEKTGLWHTELNSVLLRRFLLQPIASLEVAVSHCGNCKGAFLRGFFDSEGCMHERSLTVYNGNHDSLNLVQAELRSLGIDATGPHLMRKRGGTVLIRGEDLSSQQRRHVSPH